ncbi:hypothetical protein [Ruminiclostridium josui]|uniref:hypothetical protein n=1 Tax=Ruminiclostridium josui TaxID=1499 RepID=UPI000465CB26|nr:hypothetical protein [Ruminiclostridium josui]
MYEIIRVNDVSRPLCKRFVGHINVDSTDKELAKAAILSATQKIKNSRIYSSESTKKRFNCPAHVVRLYVYVDGRPFCQSMWVDKTFADAPLPKPLNYNDWIGDIGIVW